jgi:hypothetical protein
MSANDYYDPSLDKTGGVYHPYDQNTSAANAIHIQQPGGTYAQPIQPTPFAISTTNVQAQAFNQPQPLQTRQRPPLNRWADSLCDCTSNLFPSCWCSFCYFCGIYLIAQSNFLRLFHHIK